MTCGDDVDERIARLRPYAAAGFDEVYVGQIGPTTKCSSTPTGARCFPP